jgi:hypothetical protein
VNAAEDVLIPWPPIIEDWPPARLSMEGLHGRILESGDYRVLYMAADRDVVVPTHRHGAQWGVVLAGVMDLSIGEHRRTYKHGEAHYIPAGVDHTALLYAGWQGLYVFKRRSAE